MKCKVCGHRSEDHEDGICTVSECECMAFVGDPHNFEAKRLTSGCKPFKMGFRSMIIDNTISEVAAYFYNSDNADIAVEALNNIKSTPEA